MADDRKFINVQAESMPAENEKELREWLIKSESFLVIGAAESEIRALLGEAANIFVNESAYPDFEIKRKELLAKVQKYVSFIEVLQQFQKQQSPFKTITL